MFRVDRGVMHRKLGLQVTETTITKQSSDGQLIEPERKQEIVLCKQDRNIVCQHASLRTYRLIFLFDLPVCLLLGFRHGLSHVLYASGGVWRGVLLCDQFMLYERFLEWMFSLFRAKVLTKNCHHFSDAWPP